MSAAPTFTSVTRLRLRSLRFLPAFALRALAASRQVARAEGFLGGYLAVEGALGFWTVTCWASEDAMRRYRTEAAHGRAMPRLVNWCDEASVAHWAGAGSAPPDLASVRDHLARTGRLSKVRHPSPAQAAGRITGTPRPLRMGPAIAPR